MEESKAQYYIGQVIHHKLFDYRGVIVDIDPNFQGTEEWYQKMAPSRPPKNEPWYTILVHGGVHKTYVAERNIELDKGTDSITHPEIEDYFERFEKGVYILKRTGH